MNHYGLNLPNAEAFFVSVSLMLTWVALTRSITGCSFEFATHCQFLDPSGLVTER